MHGGSSLYELDEAALAEAEPDLILTQELCRVCAVSYREVNAVARTLDADTTVVSLEPTSIEGILNTIATVGAMAEAEDEAMELVGLAARAARRDRGARRGATRLGPVRRSGSSGSSGSTRRSRPVTGCPSRSGAPAAGTCSARTASGRARPRGTPSPRSIRRCSILMPCGFHLPETVTEWSRTPKPTWYRELTAVRRGQVFAVDGSAYFSRPGPRVIDGIELLAEILDPDAFVDVAPLGSWTPIQG